MQAEDLLGFPANGARFLAKGEGKDTERKRKRKKEREREREREREGQVVARCHVNNKRQKTARGERPGVFRGGVTRA